MKRLMTHSVCGMAITLLMLIVFATASKADSRGIPFYKYYSAKAYNAHVRNYDVTCDDYGTVFVANFEGLLYFDGAQWRKIHTPGISRIISLAKGKDGRIWFGGYNVLGYIVPDDIGRLQMKTIISDKKVKNKFEIDLIAAKDKGIFAHTTDGKTYMVKDNNSLSEVKDPRDMLVVDDGKNVSYVLPNKASINYGFSEPIRFGYPDGKTASFPSTLSETIGEIYCVDFDKNHTVWATGGNGLFTVNVITPYSKMAEEEGIHGAVYTINELNGVVYVGTTKGLYSISDGHTRPIDEVGSACWALVEDGKEALLAGSSTGLYRITSAGVARLTDQYVLSVCVDKAKGDYIVGELDGIYRVSRNGQRTLLSHIAKPISIKKGQNSILVKNIYRAMWQIKEGNDGAVTETCIREKADPKEPYISYTDRNNVMWTTDEDGYNLKIATPNDACKAFAKWITPWLFPIKTRQLRTIFIDHDGNLLAGGDFGVIFLSVNYAKKMETPVVSKPYIREVKVLNDSIAWGGFEGITLKPVTMIEDIDLPSDCEYLNISFASPNSMTIRPNQYRFRVNGGVWSGWSEKTNVEFHGLDYGSMTVEIQARGVFGTESEISTVECYVHYPFYMRWYAVVFYLILLGAIVSLFMSWRTKRLEKEKAKLEGLVRERTSELSDALDDLKRTQNDLVRMERTATAGKLTQGLIDRILNPINYINNFSKLTAGLAKDLREDIEDEKDNMTEDNYEDCEDILDMMTQNLSKIEEHGVNTTRTLRAMEAMLNNHIGALSSHDMVMICRQVVSVTADYHSKQIADHGITLRSELPETPVMLDIDAEAINRVLMSLLTNSIYAVCKKAAQGPYNAEVVLRLTVEDGVTITIHDNGIGIEDAIKDKVFDPFFTTKPTGEAAGVGLYITRELLQDHNASIRFDSRQGEYTEFVIKFA